MCVCLDIMAAKRPEMMTILDISFLYFNFFLWRFPSCCAPVDYFPLNASSVNNTFQLVLYATIGLYGPALLGRMSTRSTLSSIQFNSINTLEFDCDHKLPFVFGQQSSSISIGLILATWNSYLPIKIFPILPKSIRDDCNTI